MSIDSLPLWLLLVVFGIAAGVVWVAGVKLSETTDVLDARLHLGSAFGGLVVLALATNLPEIAITVSAAVSGRLEVAVGNILGGIALQTVVLAILDFFGRRGQGLRPLTYRAASLTLVVEGLSVLGVLGAVIAGSQLPSSLELARLTPDVVLITALWICGLYLVRQAGTGLPWHQDGEAPDNSPHPRGHRQRPSARAGRRDSGSGDQAGRGIGHTVATFSLSALATLVAGVALERSGEAASTQVGLSGVLFGATLLALATSLPEVSTGLQAIRQGDDNLAMSDIFGGNAFLPVLFLVATVISGKAVLPHAHSSDIYLTAVAMLLTLAYLVGLIFRPRRRVAGMGIDSLAVVVLYVVGVAGLIAIAR